MIGLAGIGIIIAGMLALLLLRDPDTRATEDENGQSQKTISQTQSSATGRPVQVLKPQRRDIAKVLSLPANISPWYQATLYAKVSGYLASVEVDKGDVVTKGQLLANIDAPEIEEQYQQAEAQHAIKQVTYRRLYNVWKEDADVIAKQDVDVAQADAKAAKYLMDNRRTMLGYTKVYAPFSGVITARFADPGTLIQSATTSATQAAPLFTIMDLDTVRVYVSIPQEAAEFATPGTPVTLSVKKVAGKELHAAITRTTQSLDPATRTLLVEIDVANQERQLQPGMFVNAKLYLQNHLNALALPTSAIIAGNGDLESSVLVVEENRVHRVSIKAGLDDGVWVEVIEGLTGNEDVVVVGKSDLTDGSPVKASPYNFPAGSPARQKY